MGSEIQNKLYHYFEIKTSVLGVLAEEKIISKNDFDLIKDNDNCYVASMFKEMVTIYDYLLQQQEKYTAELKKIRRVKKDFNVIQKNMYKKGWLKFIFRDPVKRERLIWFFARERFVKKRLKQLNDWQLKSVANNPVIKIKRIGGDLVFKDGQGNQYKSNDVLGDCYVVRTVKPSGEFYFKIKIDKVDISPLRLKKINENEYSFIRCIEENRESEYTDLILVNEVNKKTGFVMGSSKKVFFEKDVLIEFIKNIKVDFERSYESMIKSLNSDY